MTAADRAEANRANKEWEADQARKEQSAAQHSEKSQLTLNQGDVNKAEAMRSSLDKMFFEYRKLSSIPPEWLDAGNKFGESRYEKLEMLLMDAAEEMSDLVNDMKSRGI